MRFCIALSMLSLGWMTPVLALDPELELTQFIFRSWDARDGLPQNTVTSIVQSGDGYLWFGTQEGLVRFDGLNMEVFDRNNTPAVTHPSINAIAEDRLGRLWIGAEDGSLVSYQDGVFTNQTHRLPEGDHQIFLFLEATDHTLWMATYNAGVIGFKDDDIIKIDVDRGLASPTVWALAEQPRGCLWIGTEQGLFAYQDGQLVEIGEHSDLETAQIWALSARRNGELWIGTSGGIYVLHGEDVVKHEVNSQLPNEQILTLMEDSLGTMWVGLLSGGLVRICPHRVHVFSTPHGLPNPDVTSLLEDGEGSVWVGTDGGGLCHFRQGVIVPYSEYQGLPNNMVRAVTADPDGTLWIATDGGGLARFHAGAFNTFDTSDGLSHNRLKSLRRDERGGLWIGTISGGLNYLLLGRFRTFGPEEGLPIQNIGTIFEDRLGKLWITSSIGLIRYDRDSFRTFNTRDGLTSNLTTNVYEDRAGTLWIGTRGGGLNYFRDGQFGVYTTQDGLSSNLILALHEDADGNLWIGTSDHGLNRLSEGRFFSYTKEDGLFDDKILEIVDDDRGRFWISSNKGIFSVRIDDLLAFDRASGTKITCASYGRSDGMRSAECNGGTYPSAAKTKDGALWFPTIQGIVKIDPNRSARRSSPPKVLIKSVSIDRTIQDIDHAVELEPGTKKVEIKYTALCFSFPDRVRFQYRLLGYRDAWIDPGKRNVAIFTNLSPGHYTFEVRASDETGAFHHSGASLALHQKAYFFQQAWFKILVVLLAVVAGILLHRFQIHRINTRKRRLEHLVAQRTRVLEEANQRLRMAQGQVVEAGRRAGMAEIASNVLGQVDAYAKRIQDRGEALRAEIEKNQTPDMIRELARVLADRHGALETFFDQQEEGRRIREDLLNTIAGTPDEAKRLGSKVTAIKREIEQLTEIITAQQKYAKLEGTVDLVDINLLLVDALTLSKQTLSSVSIVVFKELKPITPFEGQKSDILKILVSLIHHVSETLSQNPPAHPRELHVSTHQEDQRVIVEMSHTGVVESQSRATEFSAETATEADDSQRMSWENCRFMIDQLGGSLSAGSAERGRRVVILEIPLKKQSLSTKKV